MCEKCYKKTEKSVFAENLQLVRRNAELCKENERLKSEIKLLAFRLKELERENLYLSELVFDD